MSLPLRVTKSIWYTNKTATSLSSIGRSVHLNLPKPFYPNPGSSNSYNVHFVGRALRRGPLITNSMLYSEEYNESQFLCLDFIFSVCLGKFCDAISSQKYCNETNFHFQPKKKKKFIRLVKAHVPAQTKSFLPRHLFAVYRGFFLLSVCFFGDGVGQIQCSLYTKKKNHGNSVFRASRMFVL